QHLSPDHPRPALRRLCAKPLLRRTATIPEVGGLPPAAVYFPLLPDPARHLWNLRSLGVKWQAGITAPFEPRDGYGNWFWGLTPSCLRSLVETAGFRVEAAEPEPFAQTLVCTPVSVAFSHRLPDEVEARSMAAAISSAAIATPA